MFKIDEKKCIHCGLCVNDCSANAIKFDDNKIPTLDESKCFKCQHCLAICPVGALSIFDKNPENSDEILKHNPDEILNLIKSRRSFRNYKQENVSPEKLQKLKDMLKFVPTGCNNHRLHFSFIDDIEVLNKFRNHVNERIINAINNEPENPIAQKFSGYAKRFLNGEDIIFRTAPHILVVATPEDAPCKDIDPTIALSYFELYAQSLGLGTCWCGLGEFCLLTMPELSKTLQIPTGYKAGYMMLFGEPQIKYVRTIQPEEVEIISAK